MDEVPQVVTKPASPGPSQPISYIIYLLWWMAGCLVGFPLFLGWRVQKRWQVFKLLTFVLVAAYLLVPVDVGVHVGRQWARQDTARRQEWQPFVTKINAIKVDPGDKRSGALIWYDVRRPGDERVRTFTEPVSKGEYVGERKTVWVSAKTTRIYSENPHDYWPMSSPFVPIWFGTIGLSVGLGLLKWVTWSYDQALKARTANRSLREQRLAQQPSP